jgi:adenylate cyclase class IV
MIRCKVIVKTYLIAASCLISATSRAMETESPTVKGKEVEIKFTIPSPLATKLFRDWVSQKSEEQEVEQQVEHYLIGPKTTPKYNEKLRFVDAVNTLRLRETNNQIFVTLKYRHLDNNGNTVSRDELEARWDELEKLRPIFERLGHAEQLTHTNFEDLLNLFNELGYNCETKFTKERKPYVIPYSFVKPETSRGNYEVVFDTVHFDESTKEFIEVELKDLPDTTPLAEAKYALYQLLQKSGLTAVDVYDRGYVHMAWNPHVNFAERRDTMTGEVIPPMIQAYPPSQGAKRSCSSDMKFGISF